MTFLQNFLNAAAKRLAKKMVTAPDATFGELDGMKYQYAVIHVSPITIAQVVVSIPFEISGQVQLRPSVGQAPLWDNYSKLESVEFNDRVKVFATTKKLAYEILSPDVMAWYLDLKEHPQLLIRDRSCIVAFPVTSLTKEDHLTIAAKLFYYLQHSAVQQ